MDQKTIDIYKHVGIIAKEIREFAKEFIKEGVLLIDIAKKIHQKIHALGAEPAFPVNLSIDDVAAHYHPLHDDKTTAKGLLKVDIGVHIDGIIADTSISIDLTKNKQHTALIKATENALTEALALLKKNPTLHDIGECIQRTITKEGFSPVINLSGHSIEKFQIHAGITIPNYGNGNMHTLAPGVYAIEPFATTGVGKIYEGQPGNIYAIIQQKNIRSSTARAILAYAHEKHKNLPFSYNEIEEKFGKRARLALAELTRASILHSYSQLIEKSHHPVAQAEHTFIKTKDNAIIITTI
ncbi:MAG: type II methionyl aminopeptidase [Nanoarchaeota archaeon]